MPPKKEAKKGAAKHAEPKHHERKDLRRAYEHLGRVEALQASVKGELSKSVHALVTLAERELGTGNGGDAADLLRAAEHFSFAALANSQNRPGKVSPELEEIVVEEVEHLTRKAERGSERSEQAAHYEVVGTILKSALEASDKALGSGAYRQALELSRGAEALAHVKQRGGKHLDAATKRPKLPKP